MKKMEDGRWKRKERIKVGKLESWKVKAFKPSNLLTFKPLNYIFLALILTLISCTGTQEIGVPRLVIIASAGDNPKLSLVQDVFFSDRAEQKRFQFLKDLTLPAPPLAYDVIDRNGQRETLVVISKNETDSFINFVNLADINPDAPDAFTFTKQESIALSSLLSTTDTRDFAPKHLQVSQNGRYIAFSNDLSDIDAIDVIDLEADNGVKLLERFSGRILSNNLVLDQTNSSNRLFFFIEEAGGAVLKYFNLPNLTAISPGFTLQNPQSNFPVDMQLISNQLVALQTNMFTPISSPTNNPTAGTAVTTISSATHLTPTNSSSLTNALIFSTSELGAHRSLSDEVSKTSLQVVDGSIEPLGGFAYFLADGSSPIRLFDIQTYNGNTEADAPSQLRSYPIYTSVDSDDTISIENATFITWAISKPPAALP